MWGLGSVRDRGGGTSSPAPRAASPRGDIPTVHSMGRPWRRAGYGCSPDITTHGPRPGEGAGEAGRSVCLTSRRRGQGMPARSKMVGVWETGEGERVPPPRRPLPPWRYLHGPAHGEIPEKNLARLPAGSNPDTAAPLISPRTAPAPLWGRGRSAEGAGGVGGRQKGMGIPTEARAGWMPEGNVWVSHYEARAEWCGRRAFECC